MIYKKKVPAIIAIQFLGEKSLMDMRHYLGARWQYIEFLQDKGILIIYNRTDIVTLKVGDYLAKDARSESFYRIEKDFFEDNYEAH